MTPPVVSIVAKSGTGKTTLLEKLIAELKTRGYRVGAVKHDAHSFSIDQPTACSVHQHRALFHARQCMRIDHVTISVSHRNMQ